jgi:cellulose synthase/poly-beta-1,6-N-acetylglucosamine synthase-like glycosyltransferase
MVPILFWISIIFIVYTYFGYPLLITLLAHIFPKKVSFQQTYPTITLLIAAYNEENIIEKKLRNCLELDYPKHKLQILVATDGSTDRTVSIIRTFASEGIEYTFIPERQGKMAAITRALTESKGDIIVFSDANNMYVRNTILELVKPFSDQTVGGVVGSKKIIKDNNNLGASEGLYWKYESFIQKQETSLGCCTAAQGEIFAIRKDLFTTPPSWVINDDAWIAWEIIKKDYRLVYKPEALSHERISPSAKDEIIRRKRINAGRFMMIKNMRKLLPWKKPLVTWQIISHKIFRPLLPFAMIGAFIFNMIAVFVPDQSHTTEIFWLSSPYNYVFFICQILFYILAYIGSFLKKGTVIQKALYLPTFLVNSNFAALSGFVGMLNASQTALWERVRRAEDKIEGVDHAE